MSDMTMIYIEPGKTTEQLEVELFTKYLTIGGEVREFVKYNQEDSDTRGHYRTAADENNHNVYSRLHNEWGCDNGRCTGAPTDHPTNLLIVDNAFVVVS
jgi:hypothetical protein